MPPTAEPMNAPAAHGAVVTAECQGVKPSPFCRNTSSRSITAAVMTAAKASQRHRRPATPAEPVSAPARCSIVPADRGPGPRAGPGPDAGPGPGWVLMTSDPPLQCRHQDEYRNEIFCSNYIRTERFVPTPCYTQFHDPDDLRAPAPRPDEWPPGRGGPQRSA